MKRRSSLGSVLALILSLVIAPHAFAAREPPAKKPAVQKSGPKLKRDLKRQDKRFKDAFAVVQQGVADKFFPGAVLAVGYRGKLVALKSFGRFDYEPNGAPVPVNAIWDMASCSKVVGTTTAVAKLAEQRKIELDAPVSRYLLEFGSSRQPAPAQNAKPLTVPLEARDRITVLNLMTHSSGLPAGAPLYKGVEDRGKLEQFFSRVNVVPLINPVGERYVYSDLSMLLMQQIVERVSEMPLDQFLAKNVFSPLGMKSTMYNPPAPLLARIAPTEDDQRLRKRVVRGEVHDENAWIVNGVAGHAGLFSSAEDLAVFEQMMLNGGIYGKTRILKKETVEAFLTRQNIPAGTFRAIGWETPAQRSSAGQYFSPRSFGHTGFTGTSMWADPEKHLFVILLTNRVYPTRANQGISKVRPAVADAVVKALGLVPAAAVASK